MLKLKTADLSQTTFTIPEGTFASGDHITLEVAFNAFIDGPDTPGGLPTSNRFVEQTSFDFVPTSEPTALALMGLGLVGLVRARRR